MRLRPLCFALAAAAALAVPIASARPADQGAGSTSEPLVVSPATASVPAPTVPDASSYLALGLPAPPPPPASPTDHPIEVPGVNAPFEVSPPTTLPAPVSTIAAVAQNLSLRVERTDTGSSSGGGNSESSGGATAPTVLGNETTRGPSRGSGSFAFTGARGLVVLIAAALVLTSAGVLVRFAARRRAS